jgi:hypothetical protein
MIRYVIGRFDSLKLVKLFSRPMAMIGDKKGWIVVYFRTSFKTAKKSAKRGYKSLIAPGTSEEHFKSSEREVF